MVVYCFNVVKHCFGSLHKPSLHIFNLSIQKGIFPDEIKIARECQYIKTMTRLIEEITGQSQFFDIFQKFGKLWD